MDAIIDELNSIVKDFEKRISLIPDSEFSAKSNPAKWSKKEVLGHLIDSAQNNLRRFICGQYEPTPPKIVYDQDFWVSANNYQQAKKEDVITFWTLINQQIAAVLSSMPEQHYQKQAETSQLYTLQWLAADYVNHMKHHLNQILPGSFNIIYP